jgi:hypothetical protein
LDTQSCLLLVGDVAPLAVVRAVCRVDALVVLDGGVLEVQIFFTEDCLLAFSDESEARRELEAEVKADMFIVCGGGSGGGSGGGGLVWFGLVWFGLVWSV